jgi:hypothetical protein
MTGLAQRFRDLWFGVKGSSPPREPVAEVIVHDPEAQRPHDLDDPFFDPEVQSRMAGVIAENAKKKS